MIDVMLALEIIGLTRRMRIYSGHRTRTKLSIDVLLPPFLSLGGSDHVFQNHLKTSLRRSFKSYRAQIPKT